MIKVCLKPNNCITNDPCAICGARCDPCGLDFFLDGTEELVCDTCAKKEAPELAAAQGLSVSRVTCDWANCDVAVIRIAPYSLEPGFSPDGWLHHCPVNYRSVDFCSEHAAPFREREWVKVREGRWVPTWDQRIKCLLELQNQFGEHLFLEEHSDDWFVIGFGGWGSSCDLSGSKYPDGLKSILADDGKINKLFEGESERRRGVPESTDNEVPS